MSNVLANAKHNPAKDFLSRYHVYFSIKFQAIDFFVYGDPCPSRIFKIAMQYAGKTYRFNFPFSVKDESTPTAEHIISMICKRSPGTFKQFLSREDYDTSSKEEKLKAKAIWQNLYDQYEELRKLLPDDIFKQLQETY